MGTHHYSAATPAAEQAMQTWHRDGWPPNMTNPFLDDAWIDHRIRWQKCADHLYKVLADAGMIEHQPKLWSQTFISCARRSSTIKCNRCQACLFILIYFNLIISPCLQVIDWYWTSKPAWTPVALKISPLTCDHVTFAQFASLAAAKHRPTNAYINLMVLHGLQELQSLSRAVDCLEF